MNRPSLPGRSPASWRRLLALVWAALVAGLYFARQVPPQWPKVYERFIAPLLTR